MWYGYWFTPGRMDTTPAGLRALVHGQPVAAVSARRACPKPPGRARPGGPVGAGWRLASAGGGGSIAPRLNACPTSTVYLTVR